MLLSIETCDETLSVYMRALKLYRRLGLSTDETIADIERIVRHKEEAIAHKAMLEAPPRVDYVTGGIEWTRIGEIDVEGGTVIVGDPCYATKEETQFTEDEIEQLGCLAVPSIVKNGTVQTRTLYGDGTYSVYAQLDYNRPKKLLIVFDDSDCPDEDEQEA